MTAYTFDQIIDFTRTSAATYVANTGFVTQTPASRNLLTYTQEFDNAAWTKANANAYPFDPAAATYGPELVTNGTFDGATGWTTGAGWSITGGQLVGTTVTGSAATTQTVNTGAGRWFAVTFTVVSVSAGQVSIGMGASLGTARSSPGTYTEYFIGTAATNGVAVYQRISDFTGTIDNISVREVIGGLIAAPDGTLTADTFIPNNGATDGNVQQVVSSASATTAYTASYYVKAAGLSSVRLRIAARTSGNAFISEMQVDANLSAGTVGAVTAGTFTGTSASITSVGNGWYRVSLTGTTPATTGILWASVRYSSAGNGTSGIYIWGAQLEANTTATDYTRNVGGVYPPRFDYDPVTLAPRGLLIEEQRTNLLLRSEEFDNASWTKTATTVTANATVSPDGTANADKLLSTAATTQMSADGSVSVTSGVSYALSVFAKASEYTLVQLRFNNAAFSNAEYATFNLATGVISQSSGSGHTIVNMGNGWYRCTIIGAATATATGAPAIQLATSPTGGRNPSITGDGTSGIYLWGAQLEAGSFPTSYIPTVASQVTRTADIATITGANFSNWYNQSEGTFVVDGRATDNENGQRFMSVSDGTATKQMWIMSAVANYVGNVYAAGAYQAQLGYSTTTGGKYALAYKANDFAFSGNGSPVSTDNSGSVPSAIQLNFGRRHDGVGQLNGHIRSVRFYPSRLSNAQLQALTA